MADKEKRKFIKRLKVGDKIQFGSYPFYADGVEKPIDWIILDIDADNNVLVISEYCLDIVRYNEKEKDVTWETSSIRKWLNNDFLNKAFTIEQQSKIIESWVENKDNEEYECESRGGNDTYDKLFLLSINEVRKCFRWDRDMQAYPTPYVHFGRHRDMQAYPTPHVGFSISDIDFSWWLRSPGGLQDMAVCACVGGGIDPCGGGVEDYRGLRPAFKINLNNLYDKIHNSEESINIVSGIIVKSDKRSSLKSNQAQLSTTARHATRRQYNVGDKITFGSYPFYEDDGEKEIDWIILDIDADNNALVISDYALDNVRYNEKNEEITWEDSTIRKWLNETFINKAFTAEEQVKIIKSYIENKDNPEYPGERGNDTYDKLFLLSIEEVNKYFKNTESIIAFSTPYAKSKNSVNGKLYVSFKYVSTDHEDLCGWWLRSTGGYYNDCAACIDLDGSIHSGNVYNDEYAVRPALKINLNNL